MKEFQFISDKRHARKLKNKQRIELVGVPYVKLKIDLNRNVEKSLVNVLLGDQIWTPKSPKNDISNDDPTVSNYGL